MLYNHFELQTLKNITVMRKILMTGLAALLLSACSNDDLTVAPNAEEGPVEQRYMAVTLVANDASATRGEDDVYTTGEEIGTQKNFTVGDSAEISVSTNNIVFFLFKDGQPYYEKSTHSGTNRITEIYDNPDTWKINDKKQVYSDVIIIVDEPEDEGQPNQIVAVINDPNKGADLEGLTLDQMRVKLIEKSANYSGEADKFMMSNSAYATGSDSEIKYVYASTVTQDNLKLTEPDAEANPVTVYVERVVAKVTSAEQGDSLDINVDGAGGRTIKIIELDENKDQKYVESGEITAKILGWNVFNKAYQTTAVKDIDNLGSLEWAWNSSTLCRSYWANVPAEGVRTSGQRLTWNQMRGNGADNAVYPFENTQYVDDDVNATSVIYAAQLLETKDGVTKPADITRWRGNYYRRAAVKHAIAKFWSKKLYKKVNDELVSIEASDIKFKVQADGYHNQAIVTGEWFNHKGEPYTEDDLDSITKENGYIQIWQNGKCYYYTPIQHPQYFAGGEEWVNALVRNHWYQVGIKSIKGLGTPVPVPNPDPNDPGYDPDDPSNPTPEPGKDEPGYDPSNPTEDDPGDIINPDPDPKEDDPDDPEWDPKDPDPDHPTNEVDPDNPYPIDPVRPDDDDEDDAWLLDAKVIIQPWRIIANSASLYSKENDK
jgi:hypothetical protein